ncbi:hypothetical protein ACFX1S_040628 [Malus domestica]
MLFEIPILPLPTKTLKLRPHPHSLQSHWPSPISKHPTSSPFFYLRKSEPPQLPKRAAQHQIFAPKLTHRYGFFSIRSFD